MKILSRLSLLFILIFQLSFAQKNNWITIDKSCSYTIISEKSKELLNSDSPIEFELYSFSGILNDIDFNTEKSSVPATKASYKIIDGKIGLSGKKLNFKKNSVYLIRLKQGINGDNFQININSKADRSKIINLESYLNKKITHGTISKESTYNSEDDSSATTFKITVADEDFFSFDDLKEKFASEISNISKTQAEKKTIFIKVKTY